jgi:branched-chain amino acid transport system ATP-binding protein
MSLLRMHGVQSGYGRTTVLHGLDLVVPQGAAVALLGANGAGKTTTLKTIAGLVPHTAGSILYKGQALKGDSPHDRSRAGICLVPEGRGIFRNLTVAENLAMHTRGQRTKDGRDKAVSYFPVLGERMRQVAGTMSGGQQQMLSMARALLTDPDLLMIDELSVGLAPVIIDELFEAVETLRREGRSILIVEQYVHRALAVADYVYILHKGRIVFVGEPSQCLGGAVFESYMGEGVA